MEAKPGYKTTEFWLTLIATAVSLALASGAIVNEVVLQALGFVASTLAAIGYAGCRALVKGSAAKASAWSAQGPTCPPEPGS